MTSSEPTPLYFSLFQHLLTVTAVILVALAAVNGLSYLHSRSRVGLTCVIISARRRKTKKKEEEASLAPSRRSPMVAPEWRAVGGRGGTRPGTSCGPGDGCTVFLGLHAQRSYAGGLAVWIDVEIVAVDSASHGRTSEKAAHVRLSHVAAAGAGHAQEVRHASGTVRMGRHARGDRVTRHNTARHWRRSAAAPDPRRVLDLKKLKSYF